MYARPNDPIDFAEQILKLLDSEPLRRQLGEPGRQGIEENLNWEIERKQNPRSYKTTPCYPACCQQDPNQPLNKVPFWMYRDSMTVWGLFSRMARSGTEFR